MPQPLSAPGEILSKGHLAQRMNTQQTSDTQIVWDWMRENKVLLEGLSVHMIAFVLTISADEKVRSAALALRKLGILEAAVSVSPDVEFTVVPMTLEFQHPKKKSSAPKSSVKFETTYKEEKFKLETTRIQEGLFLKNTNILGANLTDSFSVKNSVSDDYSSQKDTYSYAIAGERKFQLIKVEARAAKTLSVTAQKLVNQVEYAAAVKTERLIDLMSLEMNYAGNTGGTSKGTFKAAFGTKHAVTRAAFSLSQDFSEGKTTGKITGEWDLSTGATNVPLMTIGTGVEQDLSALSFSKTTLTLFFKIALGKKKN